MPKGKTGAEPVFFQQRRYLIVSFKIKIVKCLFLSDYLMLPEKIYFFIPETGLF